MKKLPIIDINGNIHEEEPMVCMSCGKLIDMKREAPSGSFLPRYEKCNVKRWKQYYNSESEQLGYGYNWDDPWG